MNCKMAQRLRRVGLLLVLAGSTGVDAGWVSDWEENGALFDAGAFDEVRTFAAGDGSALLSFATGNDFRLARIGPEGGVSWRVSLPWTEWYPADVAFESGGATLIMFTGFVYGAVARFDAAGALQWSSGVQGSQFAVGSGFVVASVTQGGEAVVTAVDSQSGQLRWQSRVPGYGSSAGYRAPLAVDATGNTYVALETDSSGNRRLAKLDANGIVQWNQPFVAATNTALAVRDGRVLVVGTQQLHAFGAADGQLQWRNDQCGASSSRIDFIGTDLLCASLGNLHRIAAASGVERWRYSGNVGVVGVFGGDVYAQTGSGDSLLLNRIAGDLGHLRWQSPLALTARERIWQLSDGLVGIVGPGTQPGSAALHRYRMDGGSVFDVRNLPEVPRGVISDGQLYDGADAFVLAQLPWKSQPARVRRLAADSGNLLWENAGNARDGFPSLAATPGRLLLAEHTEDPEARVRSLDRSSGQLRWEKPIAGYYTNYWRGKPPRIVGLDNGDVVASYGYAKYYCCGDYRHVQDVQRLADADGSAVWKKELVAEYWPDSGFQWLEPPLLRIDQDALLWPSGDGIGSAIGLQRLSGASGEPLFDTDAVDEASTVRVSVAGDAVFGARNGFGAKALRLSKRNASTGSALWQFDYPVAAGYSLQVQDLVPLADGDVLLLALQVSTATPRTQSPRLLRVKADGSGLRYAVRGLSAAQLAQDSIVRIALGNDGEALLQRRLSDGRRGLVMLQRFDLSQGRITGSQVLDPLGLELFHPRTSWGAGFEPRGEAVLISGTTHRFPAPSTRRDALLDIGVIQRGDLDLQLPALPAAAAVGDIVPLDVGVGYSGDAAVAGAVLMLDLPWKGGESGLQCAGPGIVHCEVQLRHGQIVARFDATPGARLRLTGAMRVLAAPTVEKAILRGLVYAPTGLMESEFVNNFKSIAADGAIFTDGFD